MDQIVVDVILIGRLWFSADLTGSVELLTIEHTVVVIYDDLKMAWEWGIFAQVRVLELCDLW